MLLRQTGPVIPDLWSLPVRALLLDVDDTIVDTVGAMHRAGRQGAAAAWPGLPEDRHAALSAAFYDDPAKLFDQYAAGALPFAEMRRLRYGEACRVLGLADTGFDAYEAAYSAAFCRVQASFPDAVGLLDRAREADVACVFVTNSATDLTQMKLAVAGVADRGPIVTPEIVGVGKPDARIFQAALDLADVTPELALMVGDTLSTDVLGARVVGVRAAWLQRPGMRAPRASGWGTPVDDPGVRVVSSLSDVPLG